MNALQIVVGVNLLVVSVFGIGLVLGYSAGASDRNGKP